MTWRRCTHADGVGANQGLSVAQNPLDHWGKPQWLQTNRFRGDTIEFREAKNCNAD
jgi:hypothetical protein